MVCLRCQMVVRYELEKIGLECVSVEAGRAETSGNISSDQMNALKTAFSLSGLVLLENKKNILIDRIINVVTEMIYSADYSIKTNFSFYLSKKLSYDYTYLANIFKHIQGITIEQFIIATKIQRVKQLLCHQQESLTEISWKMQYSSVAHLSTQFKKVTGITPSHYKQLGCKDYVQSRKCEL